MSEELLPILRKFWGYDSFRPLQAEAMSNVLRGRDSVVVLPTGGGFDFVRRTNDETDNPLPLIPAPRVKLGARIT